MVPRGRPRKDQPLVLNEKQLTKKNYNKTYLDRKKGLIPPFVKLDPEIASQRNRENMIKSHERRKLAKLSTKETG